MFLDEYVCVVRGGNGGDGCSSFRREKFVPRGGPDGGDGGDGGSVVFMPTSHENTLYHMTSRRSYAAEKGRQGGSSNMTGRRGQDLVIEVPLGTIVFDAERGNVLRDLKVEGEPFVVARGGKGGKGNVRFASSTNRTPRQFEQGGEGEERKVRLSLKLIADVGLVGLPNAGKSTLVSTMSRARPKIADYPFTTLEPCLGIVVTRSERAFVMADIPGLIEGAHQGKGLGDQFLKHVERTRLLLHMVDCSSGADQDPVEAYDVVRRELAGYSEELANRPTLVAATKVEDGDSETNAVTLENHVRAQTGQGVLRISAATRQGLDELTDTLLPFLSEQDD